MHNFRDLRVWKKAIHLTSKIYSQTETFPNEEKFGMTSQIRRSAISIASNIAEGSGKSSNKDFARFLEVAFSSAYELETQLIISKNINFLNETECKVVIDDVQEIQKMLYGLIKSLRNKQS